MGNPVHNPDNTGSRERGNCYMRNHKTISGRLHDELVMMDPERGKYFSLNPVATRIWDLMEKWTAVDEICGILTEEYDVDLITCRNEVLGCLSSMEELGLVLVRENEPGRCIE